MGTRNLTMVFKDGECKVAQYGQWDGYPEGQGITALMFLQSMDRNIFEEKLKLVSWITEEESKQQWVNAGANPDDEWVDMIISNKHKTLYPEISRDVGAEILGIIYRTDRELKLKNNLDFAEDSLFCEWAYLIDLDNNQFEVYKGFNTIPLTETDRFYYLQEDGDEYKPIRKVASFDLDDLPGHHEFLERFADED